MVKQIQVAENSLHIHIEIDDAGHVRLLHFSSLPFDEGCIESERQREKFRLVQICATGEVRSEHSGVKHNGGATGNRLIYRDHRNYRTADGRKLEIEMQDGGLLVISHIQLYDSIPVARCWTEAINTGDEPVDLAYISSFALTGIAKEGTQHPQDKSLLHIAHNSWQSECRWRSGSLSDFGLSSLSDYSLKRIYLTGTGSSATSEYLPMGCFENLESGTALTWQIEHNGPWYWELSDTEGQLYLQLSGPTENENHWWKQLRRGERFQSPTAAVCAISGNFAQAVGQLTRYRRAIRRKNDDNVKLPVIFNDFMNCLWGDPTPEKLIPLIDRAAAVGCEYFCIDSGWYSDGLWGNALGAWQPSQKRFPEGIAKLLTYIKAKGMIPGLWLELEVMSVGAPIAEQAPDDWFFTRHGKRAVDCDRYQLDFRNAEVIQHANAVVDRLVNEYGIGYIKMDYNLNAGIGTEHNADSFGDGLFEHTIAYLAWVDDVFARYPDLVIESCSGGGLRMNYALLSRHSVQSLTDQPDYRKMAVIAACSATAVTPEQCAVWSYPLADADAEETAFNMVNAMLLRIHQSGRLDCLAEEQLALVKEGIAFYKTIRGDIPASLPFWPMGLPDSTSGWACFGLVCSEKAYLAVWRLDSEDATADIPLSELFTGALRVRCVYPAAMPCAHRCIDDGRTLRVELKQKYSARLFEIACE